MDEEKPFYEHIDELRSRIIKSLIAVGIFSALAFYFKDKLLAILTRPVGTKLIFLSPTEAFGTFITLSIVVGFFAAFPYILYQVWGFISSMFDKKTRRMAALYFISSLLLFYGAIAFCYFLILPVALQVLGSFSSEVLVSSYTFSSYANFIMYLLLGFGIIFQFPIVMFILLELNILSVSSFKKKRRLVIVAIFIIAALLPTIDAFSLVLLALPMIALFEVTLLVARMRKKAAPAIIS